MIIRKIKESTGLDSEYIYKLIRTANHRYKIYKIPKKTGGERTISHPSRELKLLQRWTVDNIFIHFPVHDSVYSYRIGRGIRDLALLHKKNKYLLKIDFSDFFPSIKNYDVSLLIKNNANNIPFVVSEKDRGIICSIVCKNGCLTIGAPSSPIITNAILYNFDTLCLKKAKKKNVIYSRYSDDIYFSTNKQGVLEEIYEEVKNDLKRLKSPNISINDSKTVFSSKKYKRVITGLVITPENKVSIGRKKKRYIKGLVHKFNTNTITPAKLAYLKGFLSYVNAVEPIFLKHLKQKFGEETISNIIRPDMS